MRNIHNFFNFYGGIYLSVIFSAIFALSAIAFVITLFVAGIVKLVLYISGKKVTTEKKVTRRLLMTEFIVLVVSFILQTLPLLLAYIGL